MKNMVNGTFWRTDRKIAAILTKSRRNSYK